ncbi:MAG: ribosome maturation factor RimM [Bryobacteraceae bacterium]
MALAALGRVWGRRGELFAVSLSGGPERFQDLREVYLFGGPGAPGAERPVEIESVWEHRGGLVFKFRGIDSIEDAERFEHAEVRIPREARRQLPEGEYFQADLVGCEVVEKAGGERLGVVTACQEYGGPMLLEVERQPEPLLVPFARAICVEIDVGRRRIVVDLPEGLKELP